METLLFWPNQPIYHSGDDWLGLIWDSHSRFRIFSLPREGRIRPRAREASGKFGQLICLGLLLSDTETEF